MELFALISSSSLSVEIPRRPRYPVTKGSSTALLGNCRIEKSYNEEIELDK